MSVDIKKIIDKLETINVAIIGDVILDRYVWGSANRVSPEAPVIVVDVKKDGERLGGAANVALNIKKLGVNNINLYGTFSSKDLGGRALRRVLENEGISSNYLYDTEDKETSVKTRVFAENQQVVRVDRESSDEYFKGRDAFVQLIKKELPSADIIVVSDYGKGVISSDILSYLNSELSSIPTIVDPKEKNYSLYKNNFLISPNAKEASEASGVEISSIDDAHKASSILFEKWKCKNLLITLGAQGMLLYENGKEPLHIKTRAKQVFDVSGAGDTVIALLAAVIATGEDLDIAASIANLGAGIVVSKIGTAPILKEELLGLAGGL